MLSLCPALVAMVAVLWGAAWWLAAEPLPEAKRPAWLAEEGIVMAGSWQPLSFRIRRDGGAGDPPSPEQLEAYRRKHSPEMVARLKDLGVNFVMMHCYKGEGLDHERESMADAVRFAALCREQGLRVGVYNYSGAFLWEPFFHERPAAGDWLPLIRKWTGGSSLVVDAEPSLGLCAELTEQPNRRLVHLVNYRGNESVLNAAVTVRLPPNRHATSVRLSSPEHETEPTLPFTRSGTSVAFQVPRIGTCEIAVIDLAPLPNDAPPKTP